MAHHILENVRELNIEIDIPNYVLFPESFVTVSLGLATTTPTVSHDDIEDVKDCDRFRRATEEALKSSINKWVNRLEISNKFN